MAGRWPVSVKNISVALSGRADPLSRHGRPGLALDPSIAPSGMAFYDGDMFAELNGGLLVASLKFRRLYHIKLADEPARRRNRYSR